MTAGILPLFPLPVVLFPGTLIPLHIFEQRYRAMLETILEGDKRFGLIYHDPDESGPFMNEAGSVGTVAEVVNHQPLPDGRSLILVRGLYRFLIQEEVREGKPFYQARVQEMGDHSPPDPEELVRRRRGSMHLFEAALQNVPQSSGSLPAFDVEEELSFRLAAAVRMDAPWKQQLLEMRREADRLDRLDPLFRLGMSRWWEQDLEEF